jgi:hypothetical protein
LRQLDESLVVPGATDQGGAARLAERDAEFHLRHRLHDGLVQILDRLDEVRLAEDEVDVGGLVDRNGREFHGVFPCIGCQRRRTTG